MRISQRQMFTQYLGQMNTSLSSLMESNSQGGTGKKINRPSDDPAGMARVMLYRESLSNIQRNKANINEATGWLNLADHALMQVSDIIAKIKTLNLQSSTETQTDDNRDQNATQLRGYFGELLNIANEKYNGQHIFAGHKVDAPAYVEGLAVTSHKYESPAGSGTYVDLSETVDFVASGANPESVLIQFTDSDSLDNRPSFIYSKDGGKTWIESTPADWTGDPNPNSTGYPLTLNAGGVSIAIHPKTVDGFNNPVYPEVEAITPDKTDSTPAYASKESLGGTWLTVRPTAIYKGDDHDTQTTQQYGPTANGLKADGYFTRDVSVRVTSNDGTTVAYEYSLDNGSNWIKATAPGNAQQLAIPGGYVKIDSGAFAANQEFLVHPRRADINFEISSNQTVTVNNVGKDIFGGMYQEPFSDYPKTVGGANLFDTVGKLIGYCETNDSDGIGRCLEELEDCLKGITTKLADVGGRENRLQVAFETATIRELSEDNARSGIEDVDTITLMTKLAQQQLAYNTVLKSSSMIMQMSLMNFI
ncbi:MAG: flagellar hook-associated protein FlgL [Deltaproteobacteria bacterium]|nr:flagellar hook-associated protein FlgL [Deltaproteobacteria bacterium]